MPYLVPCGIEYIRFSVFQPVWIGSYYARGLFLWYSFSLQQTLLKSETGGRKARFLRAIQARPWIVSLRFQFSLLLGLFVAFAALGLGLGYGFPPVPQSQYCIPTVASNVLFGVGIVLVIIAVWFLYLLWNVRDAYLIKTEFVMLVLAGLPLLILWGISRPLNWQGIIQPALWLDLAEMWFLLTTLYVPLGGVLYYRRVFGTKAPKYDASVQLADDDLGIILKHPTLSVLFKE